jgi:two-component system sensor histidine kinase TctE
MRSDRPIRPPSLRRQLLFGLVPMLMLITAIGFAVATAVADRITDRAFDRATVTDLLSLIAQVEVGRDGRPVLDLPEQAIEILRSDPEDREFFSVRGPQGELLGGDADLLPAEVTSGQPVITREIFRGQTVHKASHRLLTPAGPVSAAFAETTVKRDRARSDLLLASLLPSLAALLVTVVTVFLAVRRSLMPLDRLGAEIRQRPIDDFSPLDPSAVPSEARPLVDAMNRLLDGLASASVAQRTFLADAAHRMRTPLTALSTQMELLVDGLPANERTRAENLRQSLKRLNRLVNQLLALARSGRDANLDRPSCPVDLAEVAEGVASEWYDHAAARGVDIAFDLEPGRVEGRAWLLHELVTNLIDNAVRYAPSGGHVMVAVRTVDGRVRLEVSDDGPGVREDEREAVFRRFYRSPEAHGEGSGLGLAIVAEIARLHDARVSVGRAEGAVFTVDFPTAHDDR